MNITALVTALVVAVVLAAAAVPMIRTPAVASAPVGLAVAELVVRELTALPACFCRWGMESGGLWDAGGLRDPLQHYL